ncbi:YdcF family protein [Streptomyces sp. NPDC060209]|uniref:YdcF family protein n=1 Tax=Streptomyces sp. NPDC060209 TaxID=3347073 RepID=UPI00364A6AC4
MRRRTGLAIAGAAAVAWGEWLNWRWSRALVGNSGGATEAVIVLGYRNPQATANLINRWRVRAGIRSIGTGGERGTRLIFSGGATSNVAAEAQLMADYAKSVLKFDGTLLLEDQSATTWENITNVIPLIEDVDRIKIASQPAHALKARAYLRRQRPDLAERLVRADDYRPGEWIVVKLPLAVYGLWTLRGLDAEERKVSLQAGRRDQRGGRTRAPRPSIRHLLR